MGSGVEEFIVFCALKILSLVPRLSRFNATPSSENAGKVAEVWDVKIATRTF